MLFLIVLLSGGECPIEIYMPRRPEPKTTTIARSPPQERRGQNDESFLDDCNDNDPRYENVIKELLEESVIITDTILNLSILIQGLVQEIVLLDIFL